MRDVVVWTLFGVLSAATGRESSAGTAKPVAFTGYIETSNGEPVKKVSFREPPKADGTGGRLIVLDVQPNGVFESTTQLPEKFVVKTFPPCLPVKTLIAAERRVVADGAQVSGAGVTGNAYGGRDYNVELGGALFTPFKGVAANLKIGGVDFSGCPGDKAVAANNDDSKKGTSK
jgi:hypothetical protein